MTRMDAALDAGSTPAASTIFVKRTNYDYGFKMYKHLEETNMTYMQHYIRSTKFALWCMKMYFVCLVHAVFPFWFTDTFSNEVKTLTIKLEEEEIK